MALESVRIDGAAPTLVFLHEGLGSLSAWRDFPERVARATGPAAVLFSRAGYGRSPMRPAPWPVGFMHEEAAALVEVLAGEGEPRSSSDTPTARRLRCSTRPRIRCARCAAGAARVRRGQDGGVDRGAARAARASRAAARHHADARATFDAWSGVWLDPAFRAWNIESCLPSVRAPVLVIQGEDDEYGTVAQVDAVARALGAPLRDAALARLRPLAAARCSRRARWKRSPPSSRASPSDEPDPERARPYPRGPLTRVTSAPHLGQVCPSMPSAPFHALSV